MNPLSVGSLIYKGLQVPKYKGKAAKIYNAALVKAAGGNYQAQQVIAAIQKLSVVKPPKVTLEESPTWPPPEIAPLPQTMQEGEPTWPPPERAYSRVVPTVQPVPDTPEPEPEPVEPFVPTEFNVMEPTPDTEDEGPSILGGLIGVGFDFKKMVKSVAKAVTPLARAALATTPVGAEAIKMFDKGSKLVQAAKQGDATAVAKIANIEKLAKGGDPAAQKALAIVQESQAPVAPGITPVAHGKAVRLDLPGGSRTFYRPSLYQQGLEK